MIVSLTEALTFCAFGKSETKDELAHRERLGIEQDVRAGNASMRRAQIAAAEAGISIEEAFRGGTRLPVRVPEIDHHLALCDRQQIDRQGSKSRLYDAAELVLEAARRGRLHLYGRLNDVGPRVAISKEEAALLEFVPELNDTDCLADIESCQSWRRVGLSQLEFEAWRSQKPLHQEVNAIEARRKRGAPVRYDWEAWKKIAFEIMEEHGPPSADDPDLPNEAALARRLLDRGLKPEPGLSTLRNQIKVWVQEYVHRIC